MSAPTSQSTVTVELRVPFDPAVSFRVTGSSRDESVPLAIQRGNGLYEPDVMSALQRLVRPDATCLDVGANLGAVALVMASLASTGRVIAFEPVPETFTFLRKNIEDNGVRNIEAINAGCFSAPGALEFHYVEEFGGGSFLSPSGASDPRERKVMVECVKLDDFLPAHGVTRVDVVKIDVEGAEDDVLDGAANLCRTQRPIMLIEFNPATARLFFGRELTGLYERLIGWNYSVSLLERPSGAPWKVPSYSELMERIERQGGVGDVLCTPGGA